MFVHVVISYGIDIVCFLLRNLENLILKASNVYVIKPVSIMKNGYAKHAIAI